MENITTGQAAGRIGEKVRLKGWVEVVRNQKQRQFIVIRDSGGKIQALHEKASRITGMGKTVSGLTPESCVVIEGLVSENKTVKLGGIEIILERIEVLSHARPELPMDEKSSLDVRMDWRYLDLRLPRNTLVFRLQTAIERYMRAFWYERDFMEIHSPKLMGCPSETGAELFAVEYFGGKAYLAQSPQFYKQMAMAAGFDRIFEIGPVFRANPSFTSRHDTEFTSVDVEISWIESHREVMELEEQWLHYVIGRTVEEYGPAVRNMFGMDIRIPEVPFPRMSLARAKEILREKYDHVLPEQEDLDSEGEKLIYEYSQKAYGHEFLFLTDYPAACRPFYHMRYAENSRITKSFDLLWKGLEVTTGAQREHRREILEAQALEKGLSLEPIKYYLDFFTYGCPPHGGYGFGFTRMLMILLGLKNVREVTYLYRGPKRLHP